MSSPFFTIKEVAQIDGVHPQTAYQRAQEGKIPGARKHGRTWRVIKKTFLEKRGITADQIEEVSK